MRNLWSLICYSPLETQHVSPASAPDRATLLASCSKKIMPLCHHKNSTFTFGTILHLVIFTTHHLPLQQTPTQNFLSVLYFHQLTSNNPQISHALPHYWQSILLLTVNKISMEIRYAGISRNTENTSQTWIIIANLHNSNNQMTTSYYMSKASCSHYHS